MALWCDWGVARGDGDADGLVFVAEMYGVQVDQLAVALDVTARRAGAIVAGWTGAGLAEAGRLGPGARWVWLTKAGLARCGLGYTAAAPALSRLAHLRAVTAVRLALAAAPQFEAGQGYWRSERRLRSKFGRKLGLREHLPDGEVHWPESGGVPWAGECWAIEAELTPKTVAKTVAIMRELLVRTGDYGCRAEEIAVPGRAARHARAIYLCSPAARPVVSRARQELGELGGRIEIRSLPAGWALAGLASRTESGQPPKSDRRRARSSRRVRAAGDSGWAVVIRRWIGLLVAQAIVRVATRLAVLVISADRRHGRGSGDGGRGRGVRRRVVARAAAATAAGRGGLVRADGGGLARPGRQPGLRPGERRDRAVPRLARVLAVGQGRVGRAGGRERRAGGDSAWAARGRRRAGLTGSGR